MSDKEFYHNFITLIIEWILRIIVLTVASTKRGQVNFQLLLVGEFLTGNIGSQGAVPVPEAFFIT
jgi:hypothetical protein